jgi:hypothetical protein
MLQPHILDLRSSETTMIVYIVTIGEYDSYRIAFVTLAKSKAEKFIAKHSHPDDMEDHRIEEYETNKHYK